VHSKLLKEKQAKSDDEWRIRKQAEERKLKRKKEDAARKEAADAANKEAAAKKEAAEKEKKEKEDAGEKEGAEEGKEEAESSKDKADEEVKKDDPKEEEPQKEEEEKKEDEQKEEEELMGDEPPAVELTDEEKATFFAPKKCPDLSSHVMSAAFSKFTTPNKSEGFDDIRYEWDSAEKANVYLKEWVANKKLNTRIEDLKPGEFFTAKAAEFGKLYQSWQDCARNSDKAEKPVKEKKEGDEEEAELDVFSVTDVMDIGDKVPLFQNFGVEDWALLQLRFELHMLVTSFKKDCDDEDRTGVPMEHVPFYYYKYFNKMFSPASFAMEDTKKMLNLVKDTVTITDVIVVSQHKEDTEYDIFVKLTEAARRDRQRRIEAGDETARLKYSPAPAAPAREAEGGERGYDRDRGTRVPSRGAFVPVDHQGKGKGFGKGKGKKYGKDFGGKF